MLSRAAVVPPLAIPRYTTSISAGFSLAIGVAVLLGWVFDITVLKSIREGLVPMRPATALCFTLAGATLWLLTRPLPPERQTRLVSAGALLLAVIGILTVMEYALGIEVALDTLLWPDRSDASGAAAAGPMSLNAALAFLALGLALFAKRAGGSRAALVSDAGCVGAFLIAFIAFGGYLYGVIPLTAVASPTRMAPHTAVGLLLLSLGVLIATPYGPVVTIAVSRSPGGLVVRRLVPAFSLVLLLLGGIGLLTAQLEIQRFEVIIAGLVVASIILFGVATAWTAFALDAAVSEHRSTTLALHASEMRYQAIVDATFDGIVVFEEDRIREANPGFAAMFGYDPSEVVGKSVGDLVPDEARDAVTALIRTGDGDAYEFTGVRRDGEPIFVEAVVRSQEHVRLVALRDVTQHRKLEDQFRQAQKMEAVGRLAGGVAHDFNNLLTVISLHTEFLLEGVSPNEERHEDLQEIRNASASAARLTRQLLAFSRQQVLDPRVLELNAVVIDVEKLLRRLIGEDVTLRTALAPTLHTIKADPGQIEQVIMNLAVNSRDAMPGGGRLILETANVELDTEYVEEHGAVIPGRYVLLAVSDTGVGMDDATKRRIFEPFFTTKELGKGTGLGLATVYGIVKQSGGYVWVYSEPGHGTTFKIYFPAVDEVPAPESRRGQPVESTLGTETVLVAEDSAAVRAGLVTVLHRKGYRVLEATDGPSAVATAMAHEGPIHLLVSDVVLPGMNGPQLAADLSRRRPDLRILFVSGYTNEALQHSILDPGLPLLQKPFTPDGLARKVREVLDAS